MSTADVFMSIRTGRLMGADDMRDRVLEYLRKKSRILASHSYSRGGVFSAFVLTAPAADQITVAGSGYATDGIGNFLEPVLCVDGVNNFMATVGFENALGTTYYVGIKYAELPSDAQQNSKGFAEFVGTKEFVGESGVPTAVVDNGNGTITFTISSLLESVKSTPRKAYVWLNVPQSSNSQHKELCTIVWDGVNSKITTTHTFGQTSVSTTAANYTVLVPGPTIRKLTDLRTESGYAYIGYVIGAGAGNVPITINVEDQNLIDTSLSDINDVLNHYSTAESISSVDAGTFASLGGTARFRSGATVFGGLIYVMGGDTSLPTGACVAENYSYNPGSNSWTAKASIPVQGGVTATRSGMKCLASSTKIYVLGGGDAGANFATSITQVYDPNANTWGTQLTSMPAERRDFFAALIGAKIYVFGGINNSGVETATFWSYDIAGNAWTVKTPFADTYSAGGSAVVDDQFYFVGGLKNGFTSNEVWRFDPVTDTWLQRANLPVNISSTRCTVVNGILYVIGGVDSSVYATRYFYAYNPTSNAWIDMGAIPQHSVRSHVFENINGIGHVIGGVTTQITTDVIVTRHSAVNLTHVFLSEQAGIVASTGQSYQRVGSGTTAITSKPSTMRSAPSVTVDNRVFFSGGETTAGAASAETWCYHPETDTYERLPDCPNSRMWGGIVYHAREHAIYAVGGQSGGFFHSGYDRYDIATKTWAGYASTLDRCGFGQPVLVGDKIYLFGGGAGAVTTASTAGQILDIRTRQVSTPAVLPAARRWSINIAIPKSTALGTEDSGAHIFVMGGDAGASVLNTIYVYDTDTNTFFTHAATLPATRGYAEISKIPGTMKAVIAGGVSPTTSATTLVTVFDFALMTGVNLTGLSAARLWTSVAFIAGLIYMFSGSSGTSAAPVGQQTASHTYSSSYLQLVTPQIKNYSTGKSADVIGFRSGEVYGLHTWLYNESQRFVITGDQ